jgi:aminopeptidase C
MNNGKLYYINLSNVVSYYTLIEMPHNYNNKYIVQHFLDKFVVIDGELFVLIINANSLSGPFSMKSLDIDNVHNLGNIKICDNNCIIFVNNNNNLMLKNIN